MENTIVFKSLDIENRTATFDVNGESVTRPISQEVTDETLPEHLQALANGLILEAEAKATEASVGVITSTPISVGTTFEYVAQVVEETPVV